MRLYSDTLTGDDVREAAYIARTKHDQDIYIDEIREGRSRKRAQRITFYAESAHGSRARNGRPGRAATWDAYGYLLAELFKRDSEMIADYYSDRRDFEAQCARTAEHYATARPGNTDHTGDFLAVLA